MRAEWRRRPSGRRIAIELLVAGLVLAVVAASGAGRGAPASGSEAAWLERSTPALDRLAVDLSDPASGPLSPHQADRLRADAHILRADGSPPGAARAAAWRRLLADVSAAVDAGGSPARTNAALEGAGLELTVLTAG